MKNRKIIIYRATLYRDGEVLRLPFERTEVADIKAIEVLRKELKEKHNADKVYFSHKQI